MKKILLCALFLLRAGLQAQNVQEGTLFPLDKLPADSLYGKQVDYTLLAFVPALDTSCLYAGMLSQAFYHYFTEKLAFEGWDKKPEVHVRYLVKKTQNFYGERLARSITTDAQVLYGAQTYFYQFSLPVPENGEASSVVFLLDAEGRILLRDDAYEAQGEHLKPLENTLKNHAGKAEAPLAWTPLKPIEVGDVAPDFDLGDGQPLSGLKGQVVLLSFYPAAFSGRLAPDIKLEIEMKHWVSCAVQIKELDALKLAVTEPGPEKNYRKLLISSSTPSLLKAWGEVLGTRDVQYVNDPGHLTARKYGSYLPEGYNRRVSCIIDTDGRIAYIDMDYAPEDETILQAKMQELLSKE